MRDDGSTFSGRAGDDRSSNNGDRDARPVRSREPMQSRRRSARIGGGSLPQEDCMGYSTILGLGLGKFKSVCCALNVAAPNAPAFETVQTTPATLHDMLAGHAGANAATVLLVIEACDSAGWVHDLAAARGVAVTVVNANDERWRWRRVK